MGGRVGGEPDLCGAFVVGHHVCTQGDHYDWMLDAGDSLITFQCPAAPGALPSGTAAAVRRLADHRRAYLTYEGPVSGGRGSIRIVERGRYEAWISPEGTWRVRTAGGGDFRLTPAGDDRYQLDRDG
ncbi:MAG: hypothetical protein GX591_07190 [Planctomycetes bacterium]|nr:hypothetical protein [Planctomycetota bacterium]